jgi:hypothetical protein
MDEGKKALKGSPSRDTFKRLHKDLDRSLWACDLDFVLVEKEPYPDIVAVLDYKQKNDAITFTEVIAYNALSQRGIPVYVVQGDAETGVFEISKYQGGHHRVPRYELKEVYATKSWEDFGEWERLLREWSRQRYSDAGRQ